MVADFEGGGRDRGVGAEQAERFKEASLLAPAAEGHACLRGEEAFDGAVAGAGGAGELGQRGVGVDAGEDLVGDLACPWIGGHGEFERMLRDDGEKIDEQAQARGVGWLGFVERADADDGDDKLAEQRWDGDDTAGLGHRRRDVRTEIERSHLDIAVHVEFVAESGGDPEGAHGRGEPYAV